MRGQLTRNARRFMAGNDNSFERQMLDFYGSAENVGVVLDRLIDPDNFEQNAGIAQIALDICFKENGISKKTVADNKARLQVELYAQLEKDRQEAGNAA